MVKEILEHLLHHPRAKDTQTGIIRWWRPDGSPERSPAEVEEALEWLVAEGFLTERGVGAAEKIYGGNPRRRREIQRHLDGLRMIAELVESGKVESGKEDTGWYK